jgi:hypothetical protein
MSCLRPLDVEYDLITLSVADCDHVTLRND